MKGLVCALILLSASALYATKQGPEKYLQGDVLTPITLTINQDSQKTNFNRNALLWERPNAEATMVVCHGYMCDKSDAGMMRLIFPKYNVLTFDFRAHGENTDDNQCCTFGKDEAYEVIAAADFVRNHPQLNTLPLGVYGFSMGAVASINAQAKRPGLFDFMILDCPYNSTELVIKTGLDNVKFTLFGYTFGLPGKSLLQRCIYHPTIQTLFKGFLKTVSHLDATATNTYIYPLSPAKLVKNITVPTLFIHCKGDEKIPISAAYELFSGARGYKRLWLTNGRRHFDSFFWGPEKYKWITNSFIKDVLEGKIAYKKQQKIIEDPQI